MSNGALQAGVGSSPGNPDISPVVWPENESMFFSNCLADIVVGPPTTVRGLGWDLVEYGGPRSARGDGGLVT